MARGCFVLRKSFLCLTAMVTLFLALALEIVGCRESEAPDARLYLRPNLDVAMAAGLPSPTDCTINLLQSDDPDQDGFKDSCEYDIAYAARPVLSFSQAEQDQTRESYYWAALYTSRNGVQRLHIAYLLAYHRDMGAGIWPFQGGHDGDSEFILSDYEWNPSTGYWTFVGAFLSAHWRSGNNHSQYYVAHQFQDINHGRPYIVVSANKHANYPSVSACASGEIVGSCAMGIWEEDMADVLASNLGQSGTRLRDCTTSVYPDVYHGQECF